MSRTKIDWTNFSWNPVTGCNPVSEGCENCYARRMAKRLRGRYGYPADDPFRVTIHENKMEEPLKWKKGRMIFVCSMGDLFHPDVDYAIILTVLETIRRTPQHTYQILTKRPMRMGRFFEEMKIKEWPFPNVWLGVTVESSRYLSRIYELLKIDAAVHFVSLEPLLEAIDISPYLPVRHPNGELLFSCREGYQPYISWCICGGETGRGARPMHPDWARKIRDQCREAGVPFFMKQMSKKAPIPDDLLIREYPRGDQR